MESRKIEGWRSRLERQIEDERLARMERAWLKRSANSKVRAELGSTLPRSRFANHWARKRDWYARNREDVLANHKAWRDANPEKVLAWSQAWASANPEARKAITARYRARHPKTDFQRLVEAIYKQLRYLSDRQELGKGPRSGRGQAPSGDGAKRNEGVQPPGDLMRAEVSA